MPRRGSIQKREILPDPKFGDRTVTRFINSLMLSGKKSIAEGILYGALDAVQERTMGEDPLEVFRAALDNVRPQVEVKSRRVGGSTYQVPVEIRAERRSALAIRWIIMAARGRSERTMRERLANEFLDAANNRGNAVRRRDETHRMAESNKAFAHYRW